MARPNHRPSSRGAAGACRDARRRPRGERRPAWVRPYRRVHYVLDTTVRLIVSSLSTVSRCERGAHRRPIRSSQDLHEASGRLVVASERLMRAARELEEASACLGREPESAGNAPELLIRATGRWAVVAELLGNAANQVFTLHENVLDGLASQTLVPERPRERRPRVVLVPRPAPVRAFLRARLARVADRITPVLHRRRRMPRPAAVNVPRRTSQGRAPPLSTICPL